MQTNKQQWNENKCENILFINGMYFKGLFERELAVELG